MIKTNLNITINEPSWETSISQLQDIAEVVFHTALDYVAKHEGIDFLSINKPININLCLSNDNEVHTFNREFRNINKPTNVLSFAAIDAPDFDTNLKLFDEIELGDIIIAHETMLREASEKQISLKDHFCHLFTHGILHLLGFDHIADDEAEHMEHFEIQILEKLNIKNPYGDE